MEDSNDNDEKAVRSKIERYMRMLEKDDKASGSLRADIYDYRWNMHSDVSIRLK